MKLDTPSRFSPTTVTLHWVVALMVIGLLCVGIYMAQNKVFALYPWHKSFGVLIILFVVLRIAWRIRNGMPSPIGNHTSVEKLLARTVEYLLLIGTLLMPLSGFIKAAMGGFGVDFFGLELVARNPDPSDPKAVVPLNGNLAQIASTVHFLVGYTLIAVIGLHVAGALKHHLIDRDGTLRRMLGAEV